MSAKSFASLILLAVFVLWWGLFSYDAEPEEVEVEPTAEPEQARAPRSKPKQTLPSQADEEAQASALKLEVRLMAEARSALARGDRKKADASLRRLRAERPRPSLAEEAEALHTEYACRYRSEAQGAGSFVAFVTRFPNSAYAKSLKSVCPRVDVVYLMTPGTPRK